MLDQGAFALGAAGCGVGAPALNLVTGIGEANHEIAVRQRGFGDRQLELVRALAAVGAGGHNLQIGRRMLFARLEEQDRTRRRD
ncbi:hypothetical protein NS341_13495, partial [Staphylococcus xylosus]